MVASGSTESHADTRMYEVVHNTFRLATDRLVDATGKQTPSDLQQIIGSRWNFYAAVLHHHHHTEDDSIFPALLAVRPDMDVLIGGLEDDHQNLEDDHQKLIRHMDAVDAAVTAFEAQPDATNQATLHEAVVAVRDMFLPHLDIEDEQILPAIAASIPAREWERMDKAVLKSIPKEQLPTAVGAIDEYVQRLPVGERPPPPPLPIRLMLALSWRKKWSIWVKPLVA